MERTATDTLGLKPRGGGRDVQSFLFLVLECDRPDAPSARFALDTLRLVTLGRGPERAIRRIQESGAAGLALSVPDPRASSQHARLVRLGDRWLIEDAGSKNGSFVNGANVERCALADGDIVQAGRSFFLYREVLGHEASRCDSEVQPAQLQDPAAQPSLLRTLCPELEAALSEVHLVAGTPVSVLVRGETGTGKELVARTLHAESGRAGAFVAVNCGALPQGLVESQLFGHRRGSFSGAHDDAPGLVLAAQRGTLFLDEIGDLSLDSQAALLRVLQEREVTPLGAERPTPVDFRLVSATHQPLEALVAEGRFRGDLLARLSGHTIQLPPLRARREDLGLLITALLRRSAGARAERLTLESDVVLALLCHDWPYNVRELEQSLSSALALAGVGNSLQLQHLPAPLRASLERLLALAVRAPAAKAPAPRERRSKRTLSEQDLSNKQQLIELLREHGGNISAVARAMNKGRMQIQRWIKRYEIDVAQYQG